MLRIQGEFYDFTILCHSHNHVKIIRPFFNSSDAPNSFQPQDFVYCSLSQKVLHISLYTPTLHSLNSFSYPSEISYYFTFLRNSPLVLYTKWAHKDTMCFSFVAFSQLYLGSWILEKFTKIIQNINKNIHLSLRFL